MSTTKTTRRRIVVYYREWSTNPGFPTLSLAQQREAALSFGWFWPFEEVAQRTEIEDTETTIRPQLIAAIKQAHSLDADLLIIDAANLIGNQEFLHQLLLADKAFGVRTIVRGITDGDYLPAKMFLDAAKFQARDRSRRTVAGLNVARAKGVKLGATIFENRAIGVAINAAKGAANRAKYLGIINKVRRQPGIRTLQDVADALMAMGVETPRGGFQWSPTQVRRYSGATEKAKRASKEDAALSEKPLADASLDEPKLLH